MSWFSDFLAKISGADELFDMAESSRRASTAALDDALAAEKKAARRAQLAATPALDREDTILARESQLEQMLRAMGARFQGQPGGAATLGYGGFGG